MESSVHAFALTLERQLATVQDLIERIDRHEDGIDAPDIAELADDDPLFDESGVGRRVKVLLHDADLPRWRQDLALDRDRLQSLLAKAKPITREPGRHRARYVPAGGRRHRRNLQPHRLLGRAGRDDAVMERLAR